VQSIMRAARERAGKEEGFTLIELMVVVLIIAILIAIAIPTFLGARSRAQDRQAQSNLRNGLTAAKTIFSDRQDYTDATTGTTGTLVGVEPSLTFVASNTASTKPKEVSVLVADTDTTTAGSDTIYMVAKSTSGSCYAVRDIQTSSSASVGYAKMASGTACQASNASGLTYSDSF